MILFTPLPQPHTALRRGGADALGSAQKRTHQSHRESDSMIPRANGLSQRTLETQLESLCTQEMMLSSMLRSRTHRESETALFRVETKTRSDAQLDYFKFMNQYFKQNWINRPLLRKYNI